MKDWKKFWDKDPLTGNDYFYWHNEETSNQIVKKGKEMINDGMDNVKKFLKTGELDSKIHEFLSLGGEFVVLEPRKLNDPLPIEKDNELCCFKSWDNEKFLDELERKINYLRSKEWMRAIEKIKPKIDPSKVIIKEPVMIKENKSKPESRKK